MSTKKDLVEAHAFSRRRLVTAFVSGAPGGREVEPSRPGRTIVGGVALGVLVLAGGAIAGVFSSRPPDGWLDPGLVVAEGSLYAITEESDEPELRPVDPISGRLIFGIDAEPSSVSEEDIAEQRLGDDIGILGAPSYLPASDQLIDEGWTACTQEGSGIALGILDSPLATAVGDGALVVTTEGEAAPRWLIAYGVVDGEQEDPQAYRYRLPGGGGRADGILADLGLPPSRDEAEVVDEEWLNLWPEGGALDDGAFDLGEGAVDGSADWFAAGRTFEAGDLVGVDDEVYLVTDRGPYALDPFEMVAYDGIGPRRSVVDGGELRTGTVADVTPPDWPDDVAPPVETDALCAMLVPRDEAPPTVRIADGYTGSLEEGEQVEPGGGAFVVSGSFGSDVGSTPYVVDGKGVRYRVEDLVSIVNLGYGDHAVRVVPDAWIGLLDCGVILSRDAALGVPDGEDPESC